MALRGPTTAASLKLGVPVCSRPPPGPSPRSNHRGLIEAVLVAPNRCGLWGSPRSNHRGLIEARASASRPSRACPLRGPTTAASLKPHHDGHDLEHRHPLRGPTTAASLKPRPTCAARCNGSPSPRSNHRGLIEADQRLDRTTNNLHSPRSNHRGLIEAQSYPSTSKVSACLSAVQPPRPH